MNNSDEEVTTHRKTEDINGFRQSIEDDDDYEVEAKDIIVDESQASKFSRFIK